MNCSFALPPAPAMPAWLGSLCSQLDSYKNSTLPQVFTPREQDPVHGRGSCTANSFLRNNNNNRLLWDQDCQLNSSNTEVRCASLAQNDAESLEPSQPWPSLQPLTADNGNLVADRLYDASHEASQPWPTCDVKKPADQSCRISDDRLTRHCFTSPSFLQKGSFVGPTGMDYSALHASDHSPTYSPRIEAVASPQTVVHDPFHLSTADDISQQNLETPSQAFVAPSLKANCSSLGKRPAPQKTPSLNRKAFRGSLNAVATSDYYPQKQMNFSTVLHTGDDDGLSGNKELSFSCVGSGDESVTPGKGTMCNPYTPASINFQGTQGTGTQLRSVEEIPMPFRDMFCFPFFNAVQSMAFDQLLYSDRSVVVSAPTGSGKTVLFELAMVRLMLCSPVPLANIKIIYIGPMKSLCGERVADWQHKLSSLGLQCVELTGDSDLSDFTSLHHIQLICTTPEKWDSVTRRWKDNRRLFQNVCLVCIDEVHVVGDSQRGATVEAVITRMKMVQMLSAGNSAQPIRFVAVSATLPNTEDIAEWLSSTSNQAAVFKLGEEYRPVRLQRVVLGYPFAEGTSDFRFDLSLTYKLQSVIDNYCHGKPTLVFCSSRKSCQQTAETLVKRRWGRSSFVLPQFRQDISAAANRIREKKLSELLMQGVGIHHAGLEVQDRKLVEDLFRAGKLAVLIATSTLSVGVNLPAHLVVVKATHIYLMGVAREYSDQQVLQMMGRAGRPQFDTSATVVIMTKARLKAKYEALVNGTQVIESMLHKNLTEHVNVEVVLNTITDMADAASWLSHTLLHVRATKNPRHYGLPAGLSTQQVEQKLQDLCMTAINRLHGLHLVSVDPDTALTSSTEEGRLMARYCLEFQTMKLLSHIPRKTSMEQLIGVIANCPEFQDIQLRTSEKKTLNSLNKNKNLETIRYPMQGKIKTKHMKVNCLVQAGLGCLPIQDYSLSQDVQKIFRVGQRITKCLMELKWLGEDYTTLLNAIHLSKAFKARLWPDSIHVARQLEGIGPTISQALVQAGLTSFQLLEAADPQHLQLVVNRHPPFGNRVHDAVSHLPRYELIIQQEKNHQATSAQLVLTIAMLNAEDVKTSSTCGPDHQIVIIVGDEENTIVYKWRLSDRMLLSQTWRCKVQVKRAVAGSALHVGLVSLDWVGLDIHTEYQPFYTASLHPESHNRQPQTEKSRAQQTKRGRTAGNPRGGDKQGQTSSKPKGPTQKTPGNKIQQQLDVMHSKLQQFQRSMLRPAEKLSHSTTPAVGAAPLFAEEAFRDSAVLPKSSGSVTSSSLQQPADSAADSTTTQPASGGKPSRPSAPDTAVSCEDNGHFSPETDLQIGALGDLVNDFWEEEDFDEPPSKTPRVSESLMDNGLTPVIAGQASTGVFVPCTPASCVTLWSQPGVNMYSNTQSPVNVNTKATLHSTGQGRTGHQTDTAVSTAEFVFPSETVRTSSAVNDTTSAADIRARSIGTPNSRRVVTSALNSTTAIVSAAVNKGTLSTVATVTSGTMSGTAASISGLTSVIVSTGALNRRDVKTSALNCGTLSASTFISRTMCPIASVNHGTSSMASALNSRTVSCAEASNMRNLNTASLVPGAATAAAVSSSGRHYPDSLAESCSGHVNSLYRSLVPSAPKSCQRTADREEADALWPSTAMVSTNTTLLRPVHPVNVTPLLPTELRARTPSLTGGVNTLTSRTALADCGPDMCAMYQQCAVDKDSEETHSIPSLSGFGWEHLHLYQSNRESMVNQDTQESSEGGGDNLSQLLETHNPYPHHPPAVTGGGSLLHSGQRLVGVTSPMVRGVVASPWNHTSNRGLDDLRSVTTEGLLDGIFGPFSSASVGVSRWDW